MKKFFFQTQLYNNQLNNININVLSNFLIVLSKNKQFINFY